MDRDETGCQAPPEGPILCINNCGFFGSATTMNLCSKCHKDFILKQEQVKTAASSIESIVNGSSHKGKEPMPADVVAMKVDVVETNITPLHPAAASAVGESGEKETKRPNRCSSCKKRVGLTGFKCRCGNLFCATHRYSDKHDCSFDYQSAGKEAIAEANPVIKAEKLDKI